MKRAGMIVTSLAAIGLLVFMFQGYAQDAKTNPAPKSGEFKTTQEKVSYGLGMNFGNNITRSLKSQDIDVDSAALLKGLQDALTGKESRVPEKDLEAAFEAFQEELIAKAKKRKEDQALERLKTDPVFKAQADKNSQEGTAFLNENKAKEGVKTTESGLQYQVLKAGTGKKPAKTDIVKTHYHGTLPNGEVFDSSRGTQIPRHVSGRWRDRRLDRSPADDARRLQMAAGRALENSLWPERGRQQNRPEPGARV